MQRIFEEGFAKPATAPWADELCSPSLVDHQFGTAWPPAADRESAHVKERHAGRARGLPGH